MRTPLTPEAAGGLRQRLELPRIFKQYNGIYYSLFLSIATITVADCSSCPPHSCAMMESGLHGNRKGRKQKGKTLYNAWLKAKG